MPAISDIQQKPRVAGEQQPVQPARVQKFDDWYYRCINGKAADGAATTHCEVTQIATVKQGDQDANILTLAIAKTTSVPVASNKKNARQQANELVLTAHFPRRARSDVALRRFPQGLGSAPSQARCSRSRRGGRLRLDAGSNTD